MELLQQQIWKEALRGYLAQFWQPFQKDLIYFINLYITMHYSTVVVLKSHWDLIAE